VVYGTDLAPTSDFREAPGVIPTHERVCIRDHALSIRVWPTRELPVFVSVGVERGESLYALRAGCPEATILGIGKQKFWVTPSPATVHIQCSPGEIDKVLDIHPNIVFFGESENPPQTKELSWWIDQMLPGGEIIVRAHSIAYESAINFIRQQGNLSEQPSTGQIKIFRLPGGPAEPKPFLSFITRTYRRPRQLAYNIASIKAQGDMDYEHILIVDDDGIGLEAANCSFKKIINQIRGEYVMILDDDDALCKVDFLSGIKSIYFFKGQPDVIIFKVWRVTEVVPTPKYWNINEFDHGNGHRVCNCYCVKREFFLDTIHAFCAPRAGDRLWQKEMFSRNPSIYWWDRICSLNMRIGRCEPEY